MTDRDHDRLDELLMQAAAVRPGIWLTFQHRRQGGRIVALVDDGGRLITPWLTPHGMMGELRRLVASGPRRPEAERRVG